MTSALTNLFSRDTMLKRHGRILRGLACHAGQSALPCPQNSIESKPLNIIMEEDESRSSSPSSCYSVSSASEGSPTLGVKARRRHATISVSDLRLSQVLPVHDFLQENDSLLSSPQPPTHTSSPPSSPDSFSLTFTDLSLEFPHPPTPTTTPLRTRQSDCHSPTHSSSSLSSSPGSQTEAMPLTPSTSDDEFASLMYRRPIIQPLVITKHNPRPSSLFDDDCTISPSLLQPFKTPLEHLTESSTALSPLSPSYLPQEFCDEASDSDSEPESDSEWYSKELSKIVSLRSPFPLQTPARPESISISSPEICPRRRRGSKLPPTPSSGGFPSAQLDPAFPRRRASKRKTIPKYPPPPVPSVSSFPVSSSPTASNSTNFKTLRHTSRRPPPHSSIPVDCVYDLPDAEDSSSTFSFSIYDIYLGDEPDLPGTESRPPSFYSQSSFDDTIDGVTFELDYPMMLPLSIPTTPFDLEADIAKGLEQLRKSPIGVQLSAVSTVQETRVPEQQVHAEVVAERPRQQRQQCQSELIDDIFSPFLTAFPSHIDANPSYPSITEEKTLKSKWSSSTLGSIREEHERHGTSAKLRLYFKGNSPLKTNKPTTPKSKKSSIPSSPHSSLSLSPRCHKTSTVSSAHAAACSFSRVSRAHSRGYSDVMVIGYGNNGNGRAVRRRGSVANSVSDAGSEESCSSSSSSGLRRKPIPVEMFLRSAV